MSLEAFWLWASLQFPADIPFEQELTLQFAFIYV